MYSRSPNNDLTLSIFSVTLFFQLLPFGRDLSRQYTTTGANGGQHPRHQLRLHRSFHETWSVMSVEDEIRALQRHLDELVGDVDPEWTKRYTLRRPRRPPGVYWQLRWLAGRILRWLESVGVRRPDPWLVSLKQSGAKAKAKPLLIWAVGTDRRALREACRGLSRLGDSLPGFVPVLVTDVADFAFFSRLGWLVEYLPRLAGEGEPYEARKATFVARLYRGAPALPVTAGLGWQPDDILRWIAHRA